MATTVGAEAMPVAEAASLDGRGPYAPAYLGDAPDGEQPSPMASHASPRSSPPLPNPPFVFPMRPSSASTPSASRASARRPRSAIETKGRPFGSDTSALGIRSSALPDFSFNPGASLSPSAAAAAFLSLPDSPASPRAIPVKPAAHGHRRGGSEFVGGNIRAGEAVTVMGTSPTKSESGMASPQLKPTHPPGRPRGHRHQRSGAISSHDLSAILQPKSPNVSVRGNSAPASPVDQPQKDHYAFPATADPPRKEEEPKVEAVHSSEPKEAADDVSPPSPLDELPQTEKPAPRARVGFSDTLEFIPRPLSVISSDTSSTVTVTARPGHSVSGSISSIMSTNSTIAEKDESLAPLEPSPSQNISDSRPSTAGAVLERTQSFQIEDASGAPPRRRGSLPLLMALPPPDPLHTADSTPSPSKTPKRWSFFGLEPFVGTNSPTRARAASPGSSGSSNRPSGSRASSAEHAAGSIQPVPETEHTRHKSGSRKAGKRQRKVKNWAGSILTRKPKPRHGKGKRGRRAPTPPPAHVMLVEDDDEAVEDSPEPPSEPVMPTVLVTEASSSQGEADAWRPPRPVEDDDMTYPMIDLDAALGPFNTPLPRNAEWEAAQRAGGTSKRPLHSAGGRFVHVHHQRAQSSPEMVPFEHGRRSLNRFGSSSTMADVFEEDEEDDDADGSKTSGESTPLAEPSIDVSSQASGVSQATAATDPSPSRTSGEAASMASPAAKGKEGDPDVVKGRHAASMRSEPSLGSLHAEVIAEEPAPFGQWRAEPARCMTADSSDSAAPSPRFVPTGKDSSLADVGPLYLPASSLAAGGPYSVAVSPPFPSPGSPAMCDANCISTAPSSVAEDTYESLLLGEPGPEVRVSVDIPSLTSSNSTMTRDSAFAQQMAQLSEPPARGDRPASFSYSAFGVRRSSLASLSRLVSSSHGERSKLSMEVTYSSDADEKKPKVSKTKRLGRMMQFWKTKENGGSA